MNLDFTEAEQQFREQVRVWLRDNLPTESWASIDTQAGFDQRRVFEREVHTAGLAVPTWPAEYGGRDASLIEWLILEDEWYAAGAPSKVTNNGISLLAPTLLRFGTPEQRARFLPAMAAADEIWAQAWSEPEAGSDLASLKSTARQDGDGFRLNGQKTWSSRAAFADWAFGPFRTGEAGARHKGLTYFLFPLVAEGVTVRPINRLDGQPGFAEIFFDDVYVPRENVIGEVDQGWTVAMTTTASERGLNLRSPGRFSATADKLLDLWRREGDPADTTLLGRVVDAWAGAEAYRLYTLETISRLSGGEAIGAESSLNKLFWSELDVEMHATALDLLGPRAELAPPVELADRDEAWMDGFLFALAGPIYAGTNEIQRNVVAERLLGLPRGSR